MNIPEFTSLLQNPNSIDLEQTVEMEELLESYPYFQAARMIHLKGLKEQQSFKYNKALKTTAAYTTNRTILFDFITSDSLSAQEDIQKKEEAISEAEIIGLEIVESQEQAQPLIAKESKVKQVEEQLEVGKPLVFDLSEMHSFNEWLQLTSAKPIVREKPGEAKKEVAKKFDLIEEFIKQKPKIKPGLKSASSNIALESVTENESLMTETLARVYLEQKKYEKAIQAFKILSLKYPEKSSFFADRIKAIKFLQKNNS